MSRSIWFFEFKGYQSSEAREIQFGYASRDYAKQTADTGLACPFYAARLQKPGDWRQVMFSDGKPPAAHRSATARSRCSGRSRATIRSAIWRSTAATPSCCSACSPTRSEEHTSELQSLMRISYA